MAIRSPDPKCPKCGLYESVRKVSVAAISSAPDDQALTRRIRPPSRPKYRSAWGVWSKCGVGLLVVGLALALVATEGNVSNLGASGVPGDPLFGYLLLANAVFLLPIAVIVARKEGERAAREAELSARMEAWERAVGHWERLYHCGKCDGVFTPDQYLLVATDDMDRYLREAVVNHDSELTERLRLAG